MILICKKRHYEKLREKKDSKAEVSEINMNERYILDLRLSTAVRTPEERSELSVRNEIVENNLSQREVCSSQVERNISEYWSVADAKNSQKDLTSNQKDVSSYKKEPETKIGEGKENTVNIVLNFNVQFVPSRETLSSIQPNYQTQSSTYPPQGAFQNFYHGLNGSHFDINSVPSTMFPNYSPYHHFPTGHAYPFYHPCRCEFCFYHPQYRQ